MPARRQSFLPTDNPYSIKMNSTINKLVKVATAVACVVVVAGCANVPLAPAEENQQAKAFSAPEVGKSGLYIYRDSFAGKALKKDVYVDDNCLGETSDRVFFYTQVDGDKPHKISTESEFSPNDLQIKTDAGKNYYVRQFIKVGMFVGGAGVEQVTEAEGQRVISKPEVKLAAQGTCGK